MNKATVEKTGKAVDSIQQRLVGYASSLTYDDLSPLARHAAKVRVIDTLGALFGGYFGEPCRIARTIAAAMPCFNGATVIGTNLKTPPHIAAFANATTARYPEMSDVYQRFYGRGAAKGHPSDTLLPVLTVAEYAQSSGRELITAIVLAYEIYQRTCDNFHNLTGFDNTTFSCFATATAAGRLLKLTPEQLAHCISIAVVPNNILRQVKKDQKTMFKATASGQAGSAGVLAALLAQAGMEGPHLPFEGKAGWCEHVAKHRFSIPVMGSTQAQEPFKILESRIKLRPAAASAAACIMAAEFVAPLNIRRVKRVIVETYKQAKESVGAGELPWNPRSREDADHSAPYLVAVALIEGTVTLSSFNDAHINSPDLRGLMKKIEVVENEDFTKAYEREPQEYCARVTVIMENQERLVGQSGGDPGDLAVAESDSQIEHKFRQMTNAVLNTRQVDRILNRLWHLEELENVAAIPPMLTFT